ncbi:MAG: hypothetical protein ACQKBW_04070 [Puniceicoccales bacterium]
MPGLLWAGALTALLVQHRFDDKIKSYQIPVGATMDRYEALLKEFGQTQSQIKSQWFTVADSPVSLLQQLNDVRSSGVELAGPASLLGRADGSTAWEVFSQQREAYGEALLKEFEAQGFDSSAFEGFVDSLDDLPEAVADPAADEAIRELAARLRGPMRAALMADGAEWVGTFGVRDRVEVPASLDSTTHVVDGRVAINHILETARRAVLKNAAIGFLAVAVVLVAVFGWRDGVTVALLPAFAVTFGLAVATLTGGGLSLLAVIGAILAYCLGLDYGAFAVHFRGQAPVSVRASALTTASAFALLGMSDIKALSDLGIVVSVSVFFAWVGAELISWTQGDLSTQDSRNDV